MRARHGRHGKLCGGGVAKAHGGGVSRRQRVVHGEGEAPKAHAGKRARGGGAKHSVHESALKAAKALVKHEQEQMQAEAHSRPGKRARGGKLTYQERKQLKPSTFVFPKERKYPIPDASHGRNALARVAQHGSPEQKAKVRSAVHRKFPNIGK